MRLRSALAACALVSATMLPGAIGAEAEAPNLQCPASGHPTHPLTSVPWYQSQLQFAALSQINQGQYVHAGTFDGQHFAAGAPVTVAVIDSGLIATHDDKTPNPIFSGADLVATYKTEKWRFDDCVGHGTEVASLIVGQPGGSRLVGIAPRVRLLPIQYTNVQMGGTPGDLATALSYAITHHARVINLSLQLPNPPDRTIRNLLAEANRHNIVVVAAGGNDSNSQGEDPVYPARYSTTLDNIIAVSGVTKNGAASTFDIPGNDISVAAPGTHMGVAVRYGGGKFDDGTSFAAPLVTGTVALMLATHPDMKPLEVRKRLEATAAPPPGTQPNSVYGWGTIDPLAAVTSESNNLITAPSPTPGPPLAAPQPAAAPDRILEHRALAIAFVLLGLAALTVTGAAVLRGQRPSRARRG